MTRRKLFILALVLAVGIFAFASYNFFRSSSRNASEQASITTPAELSEVKCQAGLLAPTADGRACSFKDIAASEIERRNLCSKEDAREALEIACKDGFEPPANIAVNPAPSPSVNPGLTSRIESEPAQTGSASAAATNCTAKVLLANERFIQNKSLACGLFGDIAADEFFKNPKSGCKSKEEALEIVKKACAGDIQEANGSASAGSVNEPLNALSNLVNCKSIAASSGDLIKKQPSLCSSASNIPAEYVSCSKEIIEVITPICLGLGQSKPATTLTGAATGQSPQSTQASAGDCAVAAKALEVDPRACQFKDLAAQEIAGRNLCTKEAAKSALDKICPATGTATSQNPPQAAGQKTCNGATIAADSEFQASKSLACGTAKSIAIQRIMARSGSPCKTEAETSKALDEACSGKITSPSSGSSNTPSTGTVTNPASGGQLNCAQIADDMTSILRNNRELCATAQTVPAEYQSCSKEISNKVALTCAGSGAGQPSSGGGSVCQGSLVVQNPMFQQNKALACGSELAKKTAVETIKSTPNSPCKTDAQAAQALQEACQLSGFGTGASASTAPSGNPVPGNNECKAYSDSLFGVVNNNRSLCNSPVPDQYKSCTDLIISTLAPICPQTTQPTSGSKCDGATVSKDAQFKQSRDLACGSGRTVAEQTIATRSDSPCKGDLAGAAKALAEACALTAGAAPAASAPPASANTAVCNGAVIAADPEFQSNKDLACTDFRNIAIQKAMSRANSPCKSEAATSQALDEACESGASSGSQDNGQPSAENPGSGTGTNNFPGQESADSGNGCTCAKIAANPEFQQNSALACANRDVAAGQVASKSNGSCSTSEARSALEEICNNRCTDSTGNAVAPQSGSATSNVPLFKIGSEPELVSGGANGGTGCTCQAIAANAEFQKNSGLACQFKSQAVAKIVESSGGKCSTSAASAELDKICSNQCTDSMGQAVTPADSGGGGGFFGSFLNTIQSIPFIGDLVGAFSGGGEDGGGGGGIMDMFSDFIGGGDSDMGGGFEDIIGNFSGGGGESMGGGGFDFAGIIETVVSTVVSTFTGFFGGLF